MHIHLRSRKNLLLLLLSFCNELNLINAGHVKRRDATEHGSKPREVGRKFFKYVTRPDIDAPTWSIKTKNEQALARGYWFVAPYQDFEQRKPGAAWVGPHIYDQSGELIWSGAGLFQHWNTFDFGVTTIAGEQMLTVLFPHGKAGLILDSSYQVRTHVALNHLNFDMHAFHLIDGGSRALIITSDHRNTTEEEAAMVDFYGKGGCSVSHVGFAELDVNNPSPPIFEWNSYRHIELDEVTFNEDRIEEECKHRWDILHANSIDKFVDNDYLISARHTDTIYKVSHKDGSIVWRLGGVYSDFDFIGPGNPIFSRQHHAQVLGQDRSHTIIALFDNAIGTGPSELKTNSVARGLILLLDTVEWTASILAEYEHPHATTVSSRGSFQILPNGNAFLCWTYSSRISEHTPNGTVVMEAVMGAEAHTYRAFKYPWIGRPSQPPDVISQAISTSRGETHTIVYVSWNGATEVDRWVLRGAQPSGAVENATLATATRTGFETVILYEEFVQYVAVEALDPNRYSLGRSEVVRTLPLEKQQSTMRYRLTGFVHNQQSDVIDSSRSRLGSPPRAFFLGFVSCMAAGSMVLVHWRRRGAILSRGFYGRTSKYDLLRQDHLQ